MKFKIKPIITQRRAFTLIEATVASSIVGIVLMALLSGMSFGYVQIKNLQENQRATQILTEKLEQIRLFNWDQITTNGIAPTFVAPYYELTNRYAAGFYYTGSVTVASAPITENYGHLLRKVTINLQWASGNTVKKREISTLVASNGLFNYVY